MRSFCLTVWWHIWQNCIHTNQVTPSFPYIPLHRPAPPFQPLLRKALRRVAHQVGPRAEEKGTSQLLLQQVRSARQSGFLNGIEPIEPPEPVILTMPSYRFTIASGVLVSSMWMLKMYTYTLARTHKHLLFYAWHCTKQTHPKVSTKMIRYYSCSYWSPSNPGVCGMGLFDKVKTNDIVVPPPEESPPTNNGTWSWDQLLDRLFLSHVNDKCMWASCLATVNGAILW